VPACHVTAIGHIAELGETFDFLESARTMNGAGTRRCVEADDAAMAELLHAFDRAPFADRIDFERAARQLRFLPALGKFLDPAGDTFRIVLVIFDVEAFVLEEALFDATRQGRSCALLSLWTRMVRSSFFRWLVKVSMPLPNH